MTKFETLYLNERELQAIRELIGVAWKGGVTNEETADLLKRLREKIEGALTNLAGGNTEEHASDERETEVAPR